MLLTGAAEGGVQAASGITGGLPSNIASLAIELGSFLCYVGLLYGVLLLVASYGLWTCQAWACTLARTLAIVGVSVGGLVVVASLVTRAGIVVSLAGLAIDVVILRYFYGSSELREYFRRYTTIPQPGDIRDQA